MAATFKPTVGTREPASPRESGKLPIPLTSFVGREREVEGVRHQLAAARLVTLTGAGGSGKTRLAIAVASRLAAESGAQVTWVELADVRDDAQVARHIAAAAGIREDSDEAAQARLLDVLGRPEALLVLDNCEQVIDGCAAAVTRLLTACPGLRCLTTSREALGVDGERAWLVPVLELPEASAPRTVAERTEAVRLFMDRARETLPRLELPDEQLDAVVEICRRLDGLPLAIELAAARVRMMPPSQLAQRLQSDGLLLASRGRSAPPRHRTLHNAIEWSYDLLDGNERRLLWRLAVFAGRFSLDMVETVCAGEPIAPVTVVDLLAALVDKSLVVMELADGEARYRMLETIRQYATEQLAESGEEHLLRERHASAYLALVLRLEPALFGGSADPVTLNALDAELPNIRAAGDWLTADPARVEDALAMYWALRWYWMTRSLVIEGRQRLEHALAAGRDAPVVSRARAMTALGLLAWSQGDFSLVEPLEESLAALRESGEQGLYASTLVVLGMTQAARGNAERAESCLVEAEELGRALQRPLLQVYATFQRGLAAHLRGDLTAAHAALTAAMEKSRSLGHSASTMNVRAALGSLAYDTGDTALAWQCVRETLATSRALGMRWSALRVAYVPLRAAVDRADFVHAARLLGAMSAMREQMGAVVISTERSQLEAATAVTVERLGKERFDVEFTSGRALEFGGALDLALANAPPDATAAPAGSRETHAAAAAPVPTLRVRTLGPLEIAVDSALLASEAFAYARPRELLLYLVMYPEGRTREQIGLVFWPDASAAQVKNNFHVTLHLARKALGRADWVVFQKERYRINPDFRVELDAAEFEIGVTRALRDLGARGLVERLRDHLRLYRGPFLDDAGAGDWHLEHRDHLHRIYVDGALALGRVLARQGHDADAAAAFRDLLKREPLHEEGTRQLMSCLSRLGERVEAMRVYERLTALLRAELDAEPEAATAALYARIRKG